MGALNNHSIVVMNDSSVNVTGDNYYGQCGVPRGVETVQPIHLPKQVGGRNSSFQTTTTRVSYTVTEGGLVLFNNNKVLTLSATEEEKGLEGYKSIEFSNVRRMVFRGYYNDVYFETYSGEYYVLDSDTTVIQVSEIPSDDIVPSGEYRYRGSIGPNQGILTWWWDGTVTVENYIGWLFPSIPREEDGTVKRTVILTDVVKLTDYASGRSYAFVTGFGEIWGTIEPRYIRDSNGMYDINPYVFGLGAGYKSITTDNYKELVKVPVPALNYIYQNANGGHGITSSGDFYWWGQVNPFVAIDDPVRLEGNVYKVPLPAIKSVNNYSYGWYMVTLEGELYTTGRNSGYEIGLPEIKTYYGLFKVELDSLVVQLAFAYGGTFIIAEKEGKRSMYVTGRNSDNFFGVGGSAYYYMTKVGTYEPYSRDKNLIVYEFTGIGIADISSVSCGRSHTLMLSRDGKVYVCGSNNDNRLGINLQGKYDTDVVTLIPTLSDVTRVSAGYNHSLFLMKDGTVKGCGSTSSGQLGMRIGASFDIPTTLKYENGETISDIVDIIAGDSSSFLIKSDGTVLRAGFNYYGLLGESATNYIETFQLIEGVDSVKSISCGEEHSVLVLQDGNALVSGDNYYGQLGLGLEVSRVRGFRQLNLDGISNCRCGGYFTLLTMNDGTVKGCGYNSYSQLGIESESGKVIEFTDLHCIGISQIATGREHSAFMDSKGVIIGSGDNSLGQLGLGIDNASSVIKNTLTINDVALLWDWYNVISTIFVKTLGGWMRASSVFIKTVGGYLQSNDLIQGRSRNGWRG